MLLTTEKRAGQSIAQLRWKKLKGQRCSFGRQSSLAPPTKRRLMVPLIIVYLCSGRQLLLRGEGAGEHFFGQNEVPCAPVFEDSPPTSTSFLEGSSTKRARRSAPRAGPREGDSHQPQISDDPMLPQRLWGTCQWLRCWLLACTKTPPLPAYELLRLRQGLAVSLALLLKESIGFPLPVMGDLPVRPTPELRKPVRLWSVGGGRHAPRVIVPFRPPLAHQLCSCWSRGEQVGDAPTLPGAADLGRGAWGPAAFPPAVAPVHTLAALDLSVNLRAPPPGAAPVGPGDTPHVGQEGSYTHWTSSWGSTAAYSRWGSSASSSGGTASRRAAPTCSVAGGGDSV